MHGVYEYAKGEGNDLIWPTNLMGYLRIKIQFDKALGQYIGEIVCFLILVFFTIWFTFTYFKRVLYMAFLTLISPLVALTYCIDKTNDGQAQGFNTWLKEYIFNLLLQPVHLLLYFILVTSAFDLAGKNVLYSLVALGFMIPAEKLLRSMFGFSKAQTPPLLGGPLGTSLTMQALNRLSGKMRRGDGHNGSIGEGNASKNRINPPEKTHNARNIEELIGNNGGNEKEDKTHYDKDNQPELEDHYDKDNQLDYETMPNLNMASNAMLDEYKNDIYNDKFDNIPQVNIQDTDGELKDSSVPGVDEIATQPRMSELPNEENDQIWGLTKGVKNFGQTAKRKISRPVGRVKKAFNGIDNGAVAIGAKINGATKTIDANLDYLAPKRWKRVKKGARIAGAVTEVGAKKLARGAVGLAAGAAVAGGAAIIGGAAAIASGDPSKVAAAAGTAVATGYAAGNNVAKANLNPKRKISPEVQQAIDRVKNKEERMEDFIKSAKKNEGIQQDLKEIDKEVAEKMLENGNFAEYMRLGYGVDKEGLKQMIASERLIEDSSEPRIKSARDAAGVKKTAERMGDVSRMDVGKQDKWKKTFSKEYMDAGIFRDEKSADNGAQTTIDLAKKYQKYLS